VLVVLFGALIFPTLMLVAWLEEPEFSLGGSERGLHGQRVRSTSEDAVFPPGLRRLPPDRPRNNQTTLWDGWYFRHGDFRLTVWWVKR
jgi:hypothetical protein